MEANQCPPPNQVIVDWLADYTRFLCASFGLPHNQADELLQHYLNLTTRDLPGPPTSPPVQQSTTYPPIPCPDHIAQFQEQSPNHSLTTHFPNLPLSDSAHSSPHHEAHAGEGVDSSYSSVTSTARNATRQGQFSPYDQHPGNMTSTDSNSSMTGTPSLQSTLPLIQTPIGSIAEYDPLWIQHENNDPVIVENFQSGMKWDVLFRSEVIKIGDVLTFQVSVLSKGELATTEAHLTVVGHSRKKLPNLSITILSDPDTRYPIAQACKTTTDVIKHLQTCHITVLHPSWRNIHVYRGEQALGSMVWVKKAFHMWRDGKDHEAQQTGQTFRARRRPRGKGISAKVVHYNGRFGVWEGKVFVPDQDQGRYRPAG